MLGKRSERENKTWSEPEKRLKFLLSLLFALVVIFVFLAANSPEGSTMMAKLRAYRQSMENHRRFQQALASDPPVGTNFKQLALNSFPYASKSPLPLLIVVFGGCEGCGAQSLK
ncbi:MAG: hypothetical protein RMK94_13170, partial [Armatimonadota bacterium]|nr:hypothetical protein [Armatimonadota bacterium]